MKEIIKGVLIDVTANKVEVKQIEYDTSNENYLDEYYKILNCSTFDIIQRKFGNYILDIYCDDEGALKENITSAVTTNNGEILEHIYGNIFIVSHDDGNTISLNELEIKSVIRNIQLILDDDIIRPILIARV